MTRASIIQHAGKQIVFIDLSHSKAADIQAAIIAAEPLIRERSPRSVLSLTDATGIDITSLTSEALGNFMTENEPYVRASAVVGLTGVGKAVLATLHVITGRKFEILERREDALAWLVQQE